MNHTAAMGDAAGGTSPPPGWYGDGSPGPALRWWDGRQWTEHTAELPGRIPVQPPLPAGTSTNTVWIWLTAFVPLLQLATFQPYLLQFATVFHAAAASRSGTVDPASIGGVFTGFAVTAIGSLVLIGALGLVAWLDWRSLRARGLVRPFHWAWGFLNGVYLVGREVVVHRRTGRGLAPLWTAVAVFVASLIIQFAEVGLIAASATAG